MESINETMKAIPAETVLKPFKHKKKKNRIKKATDIKVSHSPFPVFHSHPNHTSAELLKSVEKRRQAKVLRSLS